MSDQKDLPEYGVKNPVNNNSRVVCIVSGGMDSATLLVKLVREKKQVYAITYNYGQRHIKEIDAAKELCQHYKVEEWKIINLPIFGGSALTDNIEVPEGHYTDESMKLTVVPNRNMIMLSVAAGYAESIGAKEVYYGAHAGDHAIYWDCRETFLEQINKTLVLNDKTIQIIAPFMKLDKGDIVCLGVALKVPYNLTWTCYKGLEKSCGKCGCCVERLEAFEKARIKDPLEYE